MVQQPEGCPIAPAHIQVRGGYSDIDIENLSSLKEPISTDADVAHDVVEDVVATQPGFPYRNVQVKNTFINVKDSGEIDSTTAGQRSHRRLSHHRCVSEPLWVVRPLSEPNEPMSLSQMVPEGEADDNAFSRTCDATIELDVPSEPFLHSLSGRPSSSPASDICEGGASEDVSTAHSAGLAGYQHGRHLRQASSSSCGSAHMGVAAGVTSEGLRSLVGPDPRLSDPWAAARLAGFARTVATQGTAAQEEDAAGALHGAGSSTSSRRPSRSDERAVDATAIGKGGEERRSLRSHIRQLSTQTADGFDASFTSYSSRMEQGSDSTGIPRISAELQDFLGCMPDPRLSDPWSMSAVAAAAASSSRQPPATSAEDLDKGVAFNGNQRSEEQWMAPQACTEKLSQRSVYSSLPTALPHQMPFGAAPASAAPGFPAHAAVRPVMPSALSEVPPMWQKQAAAHPLPPGWGGFGADAEAVASAAYARGLAAGVASSAFARGFAAGAASASVVKGQSGVAAIGKRSAERTDKIANGNHRPSCPDQPLPCKWFGRGTCKFGAECRYSHEAIAEQQRPSEAASANLHQVEIVAQVKHVDACNAGEAVVTQKEGEWATPLVPGLLHSGLAKISLEGALCQASDANQKAECQVFWCDQRSFKDTSTALKDQLESELCVPVKTYRTADMCMRLLRKKRHWQSKSVERFFLVSWANAQMLIPFLSEEPSLAAKVVVLCDTCGSRGCSKAEVWAQQYPIVDVVATAWPQAVDTLKQWTRSPSPQVLNA